jgi:hypothetical protein
LGKLIIGVIVGTGVGGGGGGGGGFVVDGVVLLEHAIIAVNTIIKLGIRYFFIFFVLSQRL